MPNHDNKAAKIIRQMEPWYREEKRKNHHRPDMRALDHRARSREQRIWDDAIYAAAEFMRRYTDYDDELAYKIHGLLSYNLPRQEDQDGVQA